MNTSKFILKDHLEMILVTYNRKGFLQKTLDALLADSSPVKELKFTILDNCSTDSSTQLLEQYAQKYKNITHIRHKKNIGGNANIARAFEMASMEYVWVLADDDGYDFSAWNEVEKAMASQTDIIGVCHNTLKEKDNPVYQLMQLTLVSGAIYKTANISDTTMQNIVNNIYSMFPHLVLGIEAINNGRNILFVSKEILKIGDDLNATDYSYTRGTVKKDLWPRSRLMSWVSGYSNIISGLKNKTLRNKALLAAIEQPWTHGSFEKMCRDFMRWYPDKEDWKHILDVWSELDSEHQKKLEEVFFKRQTPLGRVKGYIKEVIRRPKTLWTGYKKR